MKIITSSLGDSIPIIVNSIEQPVSHSLGSSKIWVKQDGGQPMLQQPSPFLQERRPIFRQRGFGWERWDDAVLLALDGEGNRVAEINTQLPEQDSSPRDGKGFTKAFAIMTKERQE